MPSKHFLQTTRLVNCCQKGWFGDHVKMDPKSQFYPGALLHPITNQIPFCRVHIVGNDKGMVKIYVSLQVRQGHILTTREFLQMTMWIDDSHFHPGKSQGLWGAIKLQIFGIFNKNRTALHSEFGQQCSHDSWMSNYAKPCRGQSHVVTDSQRLQTRSQIELSEIEIFLFWDLESLGEMLCRCQGQKVSAGIQAKFLAHE